MEKQENLKLIIFADLHYLKDRPEEVNDYNYLRKLTQYSIPIADKLMMKINEEFKPDAVINLGDLIEDTWDEKKDLENLEYIWNYLKKIEPPFYSVIGNHDMRSMSNLDGIKKITGYKNMSFSIDVKGYHLIILNTELKNEMKNELGIDDGGIYKTQYVSQEDIEWLKNDLKNNNLPAIIFTHFGLAEDNMQDNYWFYGNSEMALLKNRKEIKEIIKNDKNILASFAGHQHWTKTNIEDGMKYYQIGSLTENVADNGIKQFKFEPLEPKIEVEGVPDGVYFEVNISGRNIEAIEHHIKLK